MSMRERPTDNMEKVKFSKERFYYSIRIFRYLLPYKTYFILGILALILSSVTVMVLPKIIGMLIDVSMGKSFYFIKNREQIAIILITVFGAQGIFSFLRIWLFAKVNEPALANIRKDLFNKIICMPVAFYEEKRIGDLTSRITTDIAALQDVLSLTLAEFFRQVSIFVLGIILLMLTSFVLTVIMLSSFPIVILLGVIFSRFIQKNSRETQESLSNANIVAQETFQAINMVKAYTNENFEAGRYLVRVIETMHLSLKNSLYRGAFISFIIVAIFGSLIFVLWKGTGLVEQGQMQVGELVSFLVITVFIGASMGGVSESIGRILKSLGAAERIMDILESDAESDIQPYTPHKLNGYIRFENIGFSYPARKDVTIFNGLNFEIMPGQKVALVGPSGAGKSTIVQLLLKFYEPDSGEILIDNHNINSISVKQLRGNMAIVPQEVLLFGGTIKENILYGKLGATDDEVMQAAVKANAWEFIRRFPQGMETIVGERGIKLSGGQRQRIAIARAILKDPSVLLLDEATSALDAESEKLVQEALNTLMENRTTIIIAHRLSTIRQVDKILVLNHGAIVEQGTHEELSNMENGLYNNLLKLQYQLH